MKWKEMIVAQVLRNFPDISLGAKTITQKACVRTVEVETRNKYRPNINQEHYCWIDLCLSPNE